MKFIISIFCFLSIALLFEDGLIWSDSRPLEWENFQSAPVYDIAGDAYTECEIQSESSFRNLFEVNYKVQCVFIPDKSWVNPLFNENGRLLEHEQRHFDLGECHARTLRMILQSSKSSMMEANDRLLFLTDSLSLVFGSLQDQYDLESKHSQNIEFQNKWSNRIDSLLRTLDDYQETQFTVTNS